MPRNKIIISDILNTKDGRKKWLYTISFALKNGNECGIFLSNKEIKDGEGQFKKLPCLKDFIRMLNKHDTAKRVYIKE